MCVAIRGDFVSNSLRPLGHPVGCSSRIYRVCFLDPLAGSACWVRLLGRCFLGLHSAVHFSYRPVWHRHSRLFNQIEGTLSALLDKRMICKLIHKISKMIHGNSRLLENENDFEFTSRPAIRLIALSMSSPQSVNEKGNRDPKGNVCNLIGL